MYFPTQQIKMCLFILRCLPSSTDLHVLVVGAAFTIYSSLTCLSNAGFPACFQSSSQQWHQCQRSTIPVNADSKAFVMTLTAYCSIKLTEEWLMLSSNTCILLHVMFKLSERPNYLACPTDLKRYLKDFQWNQNRNTLIAPIRNCFVESWSALSSYCICMGLQWSNFSEEIVSNRFYS